MTSAATFFPAKLTEPASSDLKVEVNRTAADRAPIASVAIATAVRAVTLKLRCMTHHLPFAGTGGASPGIPCPVPPAIAGAVPEVLSVL